MPLAALYFQRPCVYLQHGYAISAPFCCLRADATVALPCEQRSKGHLPKPAIPAEYSLEAPLPLVTLVDANSLMKPILFLPLFSPAVVLFCSMAMPQPLRC
jgi:hypothetical protein